jgi:hypothetical protein
MPQVYAELRAVPLRDMLAEASRESEAIALEPADEAAAFASGRRAPSANAELIEALQAAHDALAQRDQREAAVYASAVRKLWRAQAEAHVAQALTLWLESSAAARAVASVQHGERGSEPPEEETGESVASAASWGSWCLVM